MRIACLFSDRPGPQQDMLLDCLVYGLSRAFGSLNVTDVFRKAQYRLEDAEFLGEWPFNLGSTAFYAKPEAPRQAGKLDCVSAMDVLRGTNVFVVNVRFLQYAVAEGVCDQNTLEALTYFANPKNTILIDSSDSPRDWRGDPLVHKYIGGDPKLFCCRPGADCDHRLVIAVPIDHIWRVRATFGVRTCPGVYGNSLFLHAAWNDNGPVRRALMERLVRSKRHDWSLNWGSASGYSIEGTSPLPNPASYYAEMGRARVVVAARGAGIDTLRQSEAMAMGACLITDDFGFDQARHRDHVLYFNDADTMIEQIEYAMSNPEDRERIAKNGQRLYLDALCPEQQAVNMIRKAGLL